MPKLRAHRLMRSKYGVTLACAIAEQDVVRRDENEALIMSSYGEESDCARNASRIHDAIARPDWWVWG